MVLLEYKDSVTLISTRVDGWATEIPAESESVMGLFVSDIGFAHTPNRDAETSSSICYLDPTNQFIEENFNRLEGMFLVAQVYGDQYPESWYKITDVSVGQDKLLGNKIDNVAVTLKKTAELHYVS